MKRLLQGAPVVSGPANVESYREVAANGVLLTTSHDGYLARFGVVHRRLLMAAPDGSRLDGEDTLSPAPGGRIKGSDTDYALRFHLHPAVKASRLSDARGVMLVLPNRDVWTFEALDDRVELEDSVFLAGNDGPRRTGQIVIRQELAACQFDPLEFRPLDDVGFRDHGPAQLPPRAGIAAVSQASEPERPGASLKEQTWLMWQSAAKIVAPPILARYFAMTLFRPPAAPRRRSPDCSGFRASICTTSCRNESRYLRPSRYASASFSEMVRESGRGCRPLSIPGMQKGPKT